MATPLQVDPSRTITLRRRFVADMRRRFKSVQKAIDELIIENDVFGLRRLPANPLRTHVTVTKTAIKIGGKVQIMPAAWQFRNDAAKVISFRTWLEEQTKEKILTVDAQGRPWLATYIESAYKKGQLRAYRERYGALLETKAGLDLTGGGKLLGLTFMGPAEMAQVEALYTRAWGDLKGVAGATTTQLSRVLSEKLALGYAEGRNPRAIARAMRKELTGLTKRRAEVIARTEIIRAHAEAQLDAYDAMKVEKVSAKVEFATAGDERVCPQCASLDGEEMTVAQARGIIPVHPQCVLGDSIIKASDALCLMRGHYTGKIFEFITTSGRRFSVTENHILLTETGFVAAKLLCKGAKLVKAPYIEKFMDNPDVDGDETSIEDCFASSLKLGGMLSISMPASPEDFHGEGSSFNSEINIVWPDSELRNKLKMGTAQCEEGQFKVLKFVDIEMSLSEASPLTQFFHRIVSSANGGMSRFGISHILAGCARQHHQTVGSGVVSNRNILLQQPSCDGRSAAAETLGNVVDTFSTLIKTDDFSNIKLQFDELAGITISHVVDVPVYDVSTKSTIYNLNGILSSNCRCAWMPVVEPVPKKTRRRKVTYPTKI